jgi:hypothetical protein
MVELTKDEALSILQALSMFEGFLFSVEGQGARGIAELFEHPVELLTKKLTEK